jgi:hypothetical protein
MWPAAPLLGRTGNVREASENLAAGPQPFLRKLAFAMRVDNVLEAGGALDAAGVHDAGKNGAARKPASPRAQNSIRHSCHRPTYPIPRVSRHLPASPLGRRGSGPWCGPCTDWYGELIRRQSGNEHETCFLNES